MSVRFLRKKNTLLSHLGVLMLAATSTFVANVACAEDGWQESSIPMVAPKGYAREKCMKLNEGDQVHYRFSSINPLNFDIHYHPDTETLFKIKKENVSAFSGEFTSDAEQSYCFTWKNPREYAAAWDVKLEYRVLPK